MPQGDPQDRRQAEGPPAPIAPDGFEQIIAYIASGEAPLKYLGEIATGWRIPWLDWQDTDADRLERRLALRRSARKPEIRQSMAIAAMRSALARASRSTDPR